MSGGTLIALGADEVVMTEYAVLGPVDPQLGQSPAASVLRVIRSKPIAEVDDETVILADQAEKAIFQLRQGVEALLAPKLGAERSKDLAEILTEGTWTHDYPITFDVAQQFGLPVRSDMPEEIIQLMGLFPQPTRRQASVEYLPRQRHAEQPETRERVV
jgi:ClpP class serine protease